MNNEKPMYIRVLAVISVIILVALYVITLVCAIIGNGWFMRVFMAAVAATIILPVIIHLFMVMNNIRKGGKMMGEAYDYKKDDENK